MLPELYFNRDQKDPLPTGGSCLLVTDHIDSPGNFLLVRAITSAFKKATATPSSIKRFVFLVFTQDQEHWKAILSKQVISQTY